MSFKDNYLKLSKKMFGGPYSLEKMGISRGSIDSIKRGSMPSADTACKIAKVLGVTVEELVSGEKTLGRTEGVVKESREAGYDDPVEQQYISRLQYILRYSKEEYRNLITHAIDVLGERRKKQRPFNGSDRRKVSYIYKV